MSSFKIKSNLIENEIYVVAEYPLEAIKVAFPDWQWVISFKRFDNDATIFSGGSDKGDPEWAEVCEIDDLLTEENF